MGSPLNEHLIAIKNILGFSRMREHAADIYPAGLTGLKNILCTFPAFMRGRSSLPPPPPLEEKSYIAQHFKKEN